MHHSPCSKYGRPFTLLGLIASDGEAVVSSVLFEQPPSCLLAAANPGKWGTVRDSARECLPAVFQLLHNCSPTAPSERPPSRSLLPTALQPPSSQLPSPPPSSYSYPALFLHLTPRPSARQVIAVEDGPEIPIM